MENINQGQVNNINEMKRYIYLGQETIEVRAKSVKQAIEMILSKMKNPMPKNWIKNRLSAFED